LLCTLSFVVARTRPVAAPVCDSEAIETRYNLVARAQAVTSSPTGVMMGLECFGLLIRPEMPPVSGWARKNVRARRGSGA